MFEHDKFTYYFGSFSSGDKEKFFLLKEEDFEKRQESVDKIYYNTVFKIKATPKESNDIFASFVKDRKEGLSVDKYDSIKESIKVKRTGILSGDVGIYQDKGGGHHAIIVIPGEERSGMLFLTSSNKWNPKCRKITDEERVLLGRPLREYENYLAPVFRDNDSFISEGFKYPAHRIRELAQEFWPNIEID